MLVIFEIPDGALTEDALRMLIERETLWVFSDKWALKNGTIDETFPDNFGDTSFTGQSED